MATTTATATATRNRIPDIKPLESSNGTWILRFNFKGKQQYLSLGKGKSAYALGLTLSERIKSDIALGQYEGISQYSPKPVTQSPQTNDKPVNKGIDYIAVLEAYLGHLEGIGRSESHKKSIRTLIQKFTKSSNSLESALELFPSLASRNRAIGQIRSALSFSNVSIPDNFPKVFKESSNNSSKDIQDDVFSKEEISRILEWFSLSESYSHYLPFVHFRFLTGCRPSEAIALHWDDVDLVNNRIAIKRSYTELEGLRGRKNGECTYLPINASLRTLLERQKDLQNHPVLVFPSPSGTFINLCNFDRRAWKSCKEGTGINKRFYAIRHTVLSHLVQDQGLATAAYVAGHKSLEMVNRHYGKLLNVPVLPEF